MSADERFFSNPGRTSNYWSPEPFPTIADVEVEARPTETFGIQMVWRSAAHGVVATFPWWDNLESDVRFDDPDWWPVGTEADHFFDADQGWVFEAWADDRYVYVIEGHELGTWERRYKVPRDTFLVAWRAGVRQIKSAVPPRRSSIHR